MGIKTEKTLQQLENEVKALKATYNVSGGLINSYLSVSPTYDGENFVGLAKVQFTPDFKPKGNLLVSSIRCDLTNNNFLSSYAIVAIQDGSGDIIIQIPVVGENFSISLVTTSPGSFTRIA